VNGQIQYGPAHPLTVAPTRIRRPMPAADPSRFPDAGTASRVVTLLLGASGLTAGLLVAAPSDTSHIFVAAMVGGSWLSLVLAMTLPRQSERAGQELLRRLSQFRHELNTIGDAPSRDALERLIARASELGLEDQEVGEELEQIRASIEALDMQARIARGDLPTANPPDPVAPGDVAHFVCPVRFGRRRSDQFGHLVLTAGWVKFRGALDMSAAWSEVETVQRDGRDIVMRVHESRRVLRFSCHSFSEAACAAVVAEHLARVAHVDNESRARECHASL